MGHIISHSPGWLKRRTDYCSKTYTLPGSIFAGFFMGHYPTPACRIRKFWKSHTSGRIGSGGFQTLTGRFGSGWVTLAPTRLDLPARVDPIREQPWVCFSCTLATPTMPIIVSQVLHQPCPSLFRRVCVLPFIFVDLVTNVRQAITAWPNEYPNV